MTKSAKGTVEEPGKNVTQKAGLNSSILAQSWGMFFEMLAYKQIWSGGILNKVNPKNTSLKCYECGHIAKENRTSQAEFRCVKCGQESNADINAARNILKLGGTKR